mgnify:CR=1 FL=1|uniref:Uncharacterized protein n=1 Tax=viral metagenome TaxID=1070528 RepID=A0A6C0BR51_9ZZZZ
MSIATFTDNTPVSEWGIIMRDEMFGMYHAEIVRIHKNVESNMRDDIRCAACDKAMWDLSADIMLYGSEPNKAIMMVEAEKYGYIWNKSLRKWSA